MANPLSIYTFNEPSVNNPVIQKASDVPVNQLISTVWGRFTSISFAILAGLAVVMLIWAGIQYMTAGGNADQVKKARQSIIYAVGGIALLVAAYAVIAVLSGGAAWLVSQINPSS